MYPKAIIFNKDGFFYDTDFQDGQEFAINYGRLDIFDIFSVLDDENLLDSEKQQQAMSLFYVDLGLLELKKQEVTAKVEELDDYRWELDTFLQDEGILSYEQEKRLETLENELKTSSNELKDIFDKCQPLFTKDAILKFYEFLNHGELKVDVTDEEKIRQDRLQKEYADLIVWKQHMKYIELGINKTFNDALKHDYNMHWHEFNDKLSEVGEDTQITHIRQVRYRLKNSVGTKEEKKSDKKLLESFPHIYGVNKKIVKKTTTENKYTIEGVIDNFKRAQKLLKNQTKK